MIRPVTNGLDPDTTRLAVKEIKADSCYTAVSLSGSCISLFAFLLHVDLLSTDHHFPLNCLFVCTSMYVTLTFFYLPATYFPPYLPTYLLPNSPSINPSIHPAIHPSLHPSIRPSIHPPNYLSVRPSVSMCVCLYLRTCPSNNNMYLYYTITAAP